MLRTSRTSTGVTGGSKAESREIVYGMPHEEWKAKYQTEASPESQAALHKSHPGHD